MKLSAKEIARRKRIAGLDSLSRAEQAQRVGICLGAWLWWLCRNGLTGRPWIRYPKPDVAEIARRLEISAMPISRGEQARLVGVSASYWSRWCRGLRESEGIVEIRRRLEVMRNGSNMVEQAKEVGLTLGGWCFWKKWAQGKFARGRHGVPAIVVEATEKGGHDEQRERS